MTPSKGNIVHDQKACLNVDNYLTALKFLISNHLGYRKASIIENCPTPNDIEETANETNTEIEENTVMERKDAGSTHVFISAHETD